MPHLHYSNRLDRLILPLAQELDKRDPFDSADIVVPNFSLEKWISLQLAQSRGIAANLRFITLEKAISESLEQNLGPQGSPDFALLKPETTRRLLLEILREKLKNSEPLWQSIRNYITPKTKLRPEAQEQRLYQLAGRLAHLFLEYEYSREDELSAHWREGRNAIDNDPLGVESWQRALWNELFGPQGVVTRHNFRIKNSAPETFQKELFTLPQFYRESENSKLDGGPSGKSQNSKSAKKALHIFGISYLSRFHQKALTKQLARVREIHLYTLNPCMEFWEDVQSLGEYKAELRRTDFGREKNVTADEFAVGELFENDNGPDSGPDKDNPFLQAWGRPGRENIRLLNQWAEWDFNPWFEETGGRRPLTVLSQLQQDILFRKPRRTESLEMEQDQSLAILACASPRREVEAVASLIWDWIRLDTDLRFNECAVIVHDMERYQHEIEQVFESVYQLPYHLIDGISGSAGRLQDAADLLLGLCFTEYTRQDLFTLINNPCFLRQFEDNFSDESVSFGEPLQIGQWFQWADELNVFYGIDSEFQREQGYLYLDQEIYHWEQAFRRLTLGGMESALSENFGEDQPGGPEIIPAELPEEWHEEAARFMLIARSLIADTRDLQKWEMSGKQWGNYLQTLVKTYLKPFDEDDNEAFQNLLRNLSAFRDLDLGHEDGPRPLRFTTIYEFFKQQQQDSLVHRGHYLAEKITVSSFQPMRPIPFKAVFLLGLGEGLFPTPYQRDTLDLRHIPERLTPAIQGKNIRERHLGDVSVTERDRYMFLETLVSTRKHLVLSYVSRNDRTDDKLNPSSIIQTLSDELNSGYLKAAFQETKHPLKPYSLEYFPELSTCTGHSGGNRQLMNYDPAAFRQARALRMRELLEQKFPHFQRIAPGRFSAAPDLPDEVHKALAQPPFRIRSAVRSAVRSASTSAASVSGENSITASLSHLRKFLETPLQTSARYLSGPAVDDDEVGETIHEPLVLARLNEWSLLRKVWGNALRVPEEKMNWEKIYQQQAHRMKLEGNMPAGIFGKAIQTRHLRILKSWQKQLVNSLQTAWPTLQKNLRRFHFGTVPEGAFETGLTPLHQVGPALRISINGISGLRSGDDLNIEIQGQTEWWYVDDSVGMSETSAARNWHCIYLREKEGRDKDWLRHFLDVLFLRAADLLPDEVSVSGWCLAPEAGTSGATGTSAAKIAKSRTVFPPTRQEAQDYLADLAQAMNTETAAVLMPVEAVLTLEKENLEEEEYNARFTEWMTEELQKPGNFSNLSSQYGPVKFLEDAPLPENPYRLMKSRFRLFFEMLQND